MAIPPISRRILFFSFLLLGAASGFFIGSLSHALAAPSSKSATQQNILIVLVDDLSVEHPALEGIWLAARSADDPQISWMPIYPLPLGKDSYSQPRNAILLSGNDLADLAYLAPLRSAGIWYDEVFLFDQAGLSAIGSLAGAAAPQTDAWEQPQGALQQQVELINALCNYSWAGSNALDALLALIPAHLRVSINPFDLIPRWDSWSASDFALSCTHPWAN